MRILHLVSYPLFSGPVPPTVGLALAQRALGHTAWVAVDSKRGHLPDAFEESAAPSIAQHDLAPPWPLTLSTHSTLREYIGDVRALGAFIRKAPVDIVHVHQSHDHGLLAWHAHAPCARVRTVHAPRALRRRIGQRWMFSRVDGIIVRCEAHKQTMHAHHAPRAPVVVIPGGIDGARFAQANQAQGDAARERWGIEAHALLVGMVALLADRGQAELLQAVAQLADTRVHVLLVGQGSHADRLRALAVQLGLGARVHFAGYLAGQALVDAYAACDILFLAQAGNDASARAALEAMAAGKPLLRVATDSLAERMPNERALICPSRKPADISYLLRQWIADPAALRASAQAAQQHVLQHRHFCGEAKKTLELYTSITK